MLFASFISGLCEFRLYFQPFLVRCQAIILNWKNDKIRNQMTSTSIDE